MKKGFERAEPTLSRVVLDQDTPPSAESPPAEGSTPPLAAEQADEPETTSKDAAVHSQDAEPPASLEAPGAASAVLREPRSEAPRRRASRYSRLVLLLKVVFPALAVVLAGAVVAWPQLQKSAEDSFSLSFASIGGVSRQSQQLVNARFFSSDDQHQAYSVTSDLAEEGAPGTRTVKLSKPQADMTLKDGAWVMLSANKGLLYQDTNELDLEGSVSLFHDGGYEVHTDRVELRLKDGMANSETPVVGQGPFGSLEGEGFHLDHQQRILTLTGRSRVLLRAPESKNDTPKTPASGKKK